MTHQLALFGGTPVCSPPIPKWSWPPRGSTRGELLAQYVDEGRPLSIQGRDGVIADCEDELARRFGRRHALLCSSGTMALYSAYFALDLRPGDEVICPTVTFHATATPALHLGAQVVLVDVEPDTGNLDINAVAAAITPRTRAIASNAMWGHPVAQAELRALCDRHRLPWIEDISHAQFARYEGRLVGTYGEIACASLQGAKLITGGEGGVLLTDDTELYTRAVLLGHSLKRSEVTSRGTRYEALGRTGFGLKLRAHPLAALLVLDQLQNHADRWVAERGRSLTRLSEGLAGLEGLRPPVIRTTTTSMGAWYGYKPWIDTSALGVTRERLVEALAAEGLEVEIPGSPALHDLALFDPERFPIGAFAKHHHRASRFPAATRYLDGLLSLPTPTGPEDDPLLDALVEGFHKVWNHLGELRQ